MSCKFKTACFHLKVISCLLLVRKFGNTALIFLALFLIECCAVSVNPRRNHLWHHHFPHLHNKKMWLTPKRKNIFQKGKSHSHFTLKSCQISSNYYFTSQTLKTDFFSAGNMTLCSCLAVRRCLIQFPTEIKNAIGEKCPGTSIRESCVFSAWALESLFGN